MRILRIVLGVLIGLWTIVNAVPFAASVAYKFDMLPKALPGYLEEMAPLFAVMPWWYVALWAAFLTLMGTTVLRLVKGGAALSSFVAAFVANVILWATIGRLPAYAQVFAPAELLDDYGIMAGMVAAGALIWLTERKQVG